MITATQHKLLALAAEADGGAIDAPDASAAAVTKLIKRGFLISVPQADGPSRLLITEAGRASIAAPSTPTPRSRPADPKRPDAAPEPEAKEPRPKGKIGLIIELLGRDGGATVETLMAATGWQAHSVRGAIAGTIKKALGHTVVSTKTEAGRVYRIGAES